MPKLLNRGRAKFSSLVDSNLSNANITDRGLDDSRSSAVSESGAIQIVSREDWCEESRGRALVCFELSLNSVHSVSRPFRR